MRCRKSRGLLAWPSRNPEPKRFWKERRRPAQRSEITWCACLNLPKTPFWQAKNLLVDARQKAFALQFFHQTGINKVFPIALFFNLHEFEKYCRIFRTRVGKFGENFQTKIVSLLENFRIGFAQALSQLPDAEFTIGAKARQAGDETLHEALHGFTLRFYEGLPRGDLVDRVVNAAAHQIVEGPQTKLSCANRKRRQQ